MSVKTHYDNHLARFYSWMVGDFNTAVNNFQSACMRAGIAEMEAGMAVDLGAGMGIQSRALSEMGYQVTALDFSDELEKEFRGNVQNENVSLINADLLDVEQYVQPPVDLIVCWGDTLPHLQEWKDVEILAKSVFNLLKNGGSFLVSFRNYSEPLQGASRFIPVKQTDERILTCMLEYFDDHVQVTDLLHEKVNGNWQQKVSSYRKLRMKPEIFIHQMKKWGFELAFSETQGGLEIQRYEKV